MHRKFTPGKLHRGKGSGIRAWLLCGSSAGSEAAGLHVTDILPQGREQIFENVISQRGAVTGLNDDITRLSCLCCLR